MLGDRIKELRNSLKLTQDELGEKVGASKFTMSKYERGINEPDVATLKKLSEVLDCSVDYLVGKSKDPKTKYYSYEDRDLGKIEVGINDYPMDLTPDEVKEMIETLKKYHFNVDALITDMRNKDD